MTATLPVRRIPGNANGDHFKVNEQFTVVHFIRGDRRCCLTERSNTCVHVQAVERFEREEAAA